MAGQDDAKLPCRCNTGYYCRRHRRYRVSKKTYRDPSNLLDEAGIRKNQQCGGGRRVIHKRLEGDNY